MYGSFVRLARTARGLTQAQLAALSGLAQPNLSAIENDRRVPSAETLHRLLESCGFLLAGVAGPLVVTCSSTTDIVNAVPLVDEAPVITAATPMADRVRTMTAVLDASEAIIRGRGWTSST